MFRVFLFLSFLAIVFGIPRGFDFSDEGLYLFLADPDQENIGGVINYDLFFKVFHLSTGLEFGIIGLRILRLVSYLLGAYGIVVFWYNLYGKTDASFFLFALAGLFAGYAFLPPSLSYNSLSVVSACLWLGIISKKELRAFHFLLLGLIFLILFYAKITACLLLGLFTLGYFQFLQKLSFQRFLLLCIPFVLFESLSYALFGENAVSRLTGKYGFFYQREDYSLFLLIKYTLVGGFWSVLAGMLFFIAAKLKNSAAKFYFLPLALGILGVFIVFDYTFITSEWSHIVLLITFAGICWQLGFAIWDDFSEREILFLCLLIGLPYILHFGSNVYWMRLGLHYWVFWLLALMMLFRKSQEQIKNRFYMLTAFVSFILVFSGIWLWPFEGVHLWKFNESYEYKPGKKILLSREQVQFLNTLESEIGNPEQSKVLALYRNPGILYLLDMNLPHSPAYWKASQAQLFLEDGDELDLILFNQLEPFPFDRTAWKMEKELIQPNGETIQLLWKR